MTMFSKEERFRLRALMTVQNSWEERLFLEVGTPAVEDSLVNCGHASMCPFNGWSLLCVSLVSSTGWENHLSLESWVLPTCQLRFEAFSEPASHFFVSNERGGTTTRVGL